MTITISSEDPRSLKAVAIAAEAGQWAKCRTRDGQKLYAVPQPAGRQCALPGRHPLVYLS
jgi:hypothetical protein